MESNKDLTCDVIKDLLPIYCDGMASDDSVKLIEQHFAECEKCKAMYENLSENLSMEQLLDQKREINELKKIKKVFNRKTIILGILGMVLGAALFLVFFVGVVPVNSDDVTITYQASKSTDAEDESGEDCYEVEFLVSLPEGKVLEFRGDYETKDGKAFRQVHTLYNVVALPFDDRGEKPNEALLGRESNEPFDENDVMIFRFKDKTVTYNLRDIAVEEGIQ